MNVDGCRDIRETDSVSPRTGELDNCVRLDSLRGPAEGVEVIPKAANQRVTPRSAVQNVVPRISTEPVREGVSSQLIIA